MRRYFHFILIIGIFVSLQAAGQTDSQNGGDFSTNLHPNEKEKVPEGVIIVKGAWSSASDSVTPVPEEVKIDNGIFSDDYFRLKYPLPKEWRRKATGPPPSENGMYMLSLLTPGDAYKGVHGSIAVLVQDLFFTTMPASNALELINYKHENLQSDYKVELKPQEATVAGRNFVFFAYWSPVAELHWYVLATQIRCHAVQFVLTSRDTKLLEDLVLGMKNMQLPLDADVKSGTGGGDVPVCIRDYANEANVIERVEPVFTTRRFNTVPVRIIIDKEGKVKHIHYLSVFPDQEKAIGDALKKWRFRPYFNQGKPVEVETGLIFGSALRTPATSASKPTTSE